MSLKELLTAEWYRNGMHDIAQTSVQNNVPPLNATEIRENVAGFQKALFDALAAAQEGSKT